MFTESTINGWGLLLVDQSYTNIYIYAIRDFMEVLIFIISDIKETSQIKPSPEILLSNWRNKANQIY